MKGIRPLFILGIFLISLTGCPYKSKVALGDSRNAIIDSLLLGKWKGTTNVIDSKINIELNILKFNSNEYVIEYNEEGNEAELISGFITIIDNEKILNLNGLDEPTEYGFYKFAISGDSLKVNYASDNFIKNSFDSEAKLFDFFVHNIKKKDFFEDQIIFKREM